MAAGAKGGRRNKRRRELKRKARLRERLSSRNEVEPEKKLMEENRITIHEHLHVMESEKRKVERSHRNKRRRSTRKSVKSARRI